jgi:hypothetical protein
MHFCLCLSPKSTKGSQIHLALAHWKWHSPRLKNYLKPCCKDQWVDLSSKEPTAQLINIGLGHCRPSHQEYDISHNVISCRLTKTWLPLIIVKSPSVHPVWINRQGKSDSDHETPGKSEVPLRRGVDVIKLRCWSEVTVWETWHDISIKWSIWNPIRTFLFVRVWCGSSAVA